MDRLEDQATTYCISCRTNVKKSKMEGSFYKLPVSPPEDSDMVGGDHVICKPCVITLRGDMMAMSRKGEINSNSKFFSIKCSICLDVAQKAEMRVSKLEAGDASAKDNLKSSVRPKKIHKVELKLLRALMKSEGGCCCIL
jgi:hypothetical protein